MATALAPSTRCYKYGPVSISTAEETVNVTFSGGIESFMLIADCAWRYDTVAGQTNSVPFAAGQAVTMTSPSAASFTFYARTDAGSGKLYLIALE